MPVVTITHATAYRYRAAITPGPHRLMLRPRETRDLGLLGFDLQVSPEAQVDWSHDVSGNAVATAVFLSSSDTIDIRARTTVDLGASAWPVFAIAASAINYPFLYSDEDWTDLGALAAPQHADPEGRLAGWVAGFVRSRPTDTLSLLKDVSDGIAARIVYEARESEGTQGPLDTLDRGRGSCRDFAVLMAEACRTLGLGARLVSGYLHDPQGSSLGSAGSGSTHAWVEVFVPGAGWITFDPTNRAVGSANLIPVAVGRRMAQIAPVTGSFHGRPADLIGMDVAVSVEAT